MAHSYILYAGDGTRVDFPTPSYLDRSHISVLVDNNPTTAWSWLTDGTVRLEVAPQEGVSVEIRRATSPNARLVEYQNGADLDAADLNLAATQAFYLAQEALDMAERSFGVSEGRLIPDGTPGATGLGFVASPATGLRRNPVNNAIEVDVMGKVVASFQPNGNCLLGRDGLEAVFRVFPPVGDGLTTNRIEVVGAPSPFAPIVRARSSTDTDVDLRLRAQGAGVLSLPSPGEAYPLKRVAQATHVIPVKDRDGNPFYIPVTDTNADPGAPDLGALAPMTGATAGTNGAGGTVPAPAAGQQGRFLRGDGTWSGVAQNFIGATSIANGVNGYVPAPLIADRRKILFGDGTWGVAARVWRGDWFTPVANAFSVGPFSHSLGDVPYFGFLQGECLEEDIGFAVGQRVSWASSFGTVDSGNTRGVILRFTSDQYWARTGTHGIRVVRPDTGASADLTSTKWRFRPLVMLMSFATSG